jgi:hypothetical protein
MRIAQFMPSAPNEPDEWIRVLTDEWLSVNLKYVEDVDFGPHKVILWLASDRSCEVTDDNPHYPKIMEWVGRHSR